MKKTFKFLVATVALVAVMAIGSAKAAYVHTGLLKMGMTSSQVMSLQQTLNSNGFLVSTTGAGSPGMESMYFGSKTKSAVMAFQSAKGLKADGIVGVQTGTALAALTGGSVALPAGCTSTTGYSTTTGQPCTSTANYPAGCTSSVGYSPTTGQPCNGSTNGGSNGPLSGTAGDITVSSYTSGLETNVGEGDSNKKVLGFEIEADAGSDVAISSVKVNFENTGSGSKRLTRYADTISIWDQNGNKVGSSSASDFSESSNVYSRSISLSNVVIRADQKMRFYVAVTADSNIDSADYSADSWTATLDSVRFNDASGAILTESLGTSIQRTFNFTSLATANDLELKVGLSSSNLKAQTVKASTTSSTNNVELLKFTMKAQGGAMHVDQIPVLFTTSDNNLSDVTGNVTLNIDGSSFSETVSTSSSASTTITFDDLDLDLSADETITGTITADINSVTGYLEGTTLMASIPSNYVTQTSYIYIDAEDVNGDQLVTGDRSGSATGELMTFRSTGVNTVMGTADLSGKTTDTSGNVTSVTYKIPVSVTSFGNTLYVGQSAQLATTVSGSNAFALAFQTSAAPTTDEVISSASIALASSDATIESNGFRLDDGQTKHFTITVTLNTPATTNANYRVQLKQIQTFTNAALYSGAAQSNLLPAEQFRTDYQFINS